MTKSSNLTINSIRNILSSGFSLLIQIVLMFFVRTYFLKILGDSYVGLDGVFSNIISMLSLADLGINTAFMYSLYKPLASNNTKEITNLLYLFKSIYQKISIFIMIIGIAVVPFLNYIIKDVDIVKGEIVVCYFLYVVNASVSYVISYKSILLQADQEIHTIKIVKTVSNIICSILQVALLIAFRSYWLYIISLVISTLINNIIISFVTNRKYPFVMDKKDGNIKTKSEKKILSNISATMIYKLSAVLINSTDNIIMSIVLGTIAVGYYMNYNFVIRAVMSIIGVITGSVLPSIGNYLAVRSENDKKNFFEANIYVFFIIATLSSVALIVSIENIMELWLGNKYIISKFDMYMIVFSFYMQCIGNPAWMFRESAGLFKEVRIPISLTAIFNIVLSIILGVKFGIGGIVGATGLSRLLTIFWYEPRILYKKIFKTSEKMYWKKVTKYLFITAISILFSEYVVSYINLNNMFLTILFNVVVSSTFTIAFFWLLTFKSDEYLYCINKLKQIINNKVH